MGISDLTSSLPSLEFCVSCVAPLAGARGAGGAPLVEPRGRKSPARWCWSQISVAMTCGVGWGVWERLWGGVVVLSSRNVRWM
jgi:hypothetical protein